MNDRRMPSPPDDDTLARLLRSVGAEADPVLWTRVRARIVAAEAAPRSQGLWAALDWLSRPIALAGSAAALVAVLGFGSIWSRNVSQLASVTSASSASGEIEVASLGDWLLAEREAATTTTAPAPATTPTRGGASRDSGGPS